jgi:virginiamycin B lyase
MALAVLASLMLAAHAAAALAGSKARVTPYYLPRALPTGGAGPIALGPDGQVWFTEVYEEPPEEVGETAHHPPQIVRMNALGQIAVVAQHQRAEGFAVAADGSVWFTNSRRVGRVGPNDAVTTFDMPGEWSEPTISFAWESIVAGSDGNLWFSGTRQSSKGGAGGLFVNTIDRITPSGEITEFDVGPGGYLQTLALGPDGNVWYAVPGREMIGRITPSGQVTEIPLPLTSPWDIVAGPGGMLWFGAVRRERPVLGRVTLAGDVREVAVPANEESYAGPLAVGPDGRVWFATERDGILRISSDGSVSRVELPTSRQVNDLVTGPEGNVWYAASAGPPCLPGDTACGGGGYYKSGIIGRIEPAPLAVVIAGAGLAAHTRWVKVRIRCLDGHAKSICRVKLRLRAAGLVVAKRNVKLGTDLSKGFSLKLKRKARERLLHTGHLRIACRAILAGGDTATRALLVKLPRRS